MSCLNPYLIPHATTGDPFYVPPAFPEFSRQLEEYRSSGSLRSMNSLLSNYILAPCRKCVECSRKYSRDWAFRMYFESRLHKFSSFVTLTYSEDCVPSDGSVCLRHTQLFFKRLRKRLGSVKIRYAICGEYGDKNQRPHYHAIIFGLDPYAFSTRRILEDSWSLGFVHIGRSTAIACMKYVAQYVVKKRLDRDLYKEQGLVAPFFNMSRRNGIGHDYFMSKFSEWRDRIANKIPFVVINKNKYYFPTYVYKLLLSPLERFERFKDYIVSNFDSIYSEIVDRFVVRPKYYVLFSVQRTREVLLFQCRSTVF